MAISEKFGGIYELVVETGHAYVQYTYRDALMGELVRILPGIYPDRPTCFDGLAGGPESCFVYYPLKLAVRDKLVTYVASAAIPARSQGIQNMRQRWKCTRDGRVLTWKLIEKGGDRIVEVLSETELKYSFYGAANHEYLKWLISSGWRPETARENDPNAPGVREQESDDGTSEKERGEGTVVRHYLYYASRKAAAHAAELVRVKGYAAEFADEDYEGLWLLLLTHRVVPTTETIDQAMEELERFAQETGGEYDGHEVELG